jgi:hypothetical protein
MNDYLTKNPADYKSVRRVVGAHASIMHEWEKGAWHKLDKWAPKAYKRLQANWATYKDLLGRLDSPDLHAAMCIYVHYLSYDRPKDVSKAEPIESGVSCLPAGNLVGTIMVRRMFGKNPSNCCWLKKNRSTCSAMP